MKTLIVFFITFIGSFLYSQAPKTATTMPSTTPQTMQMQAIGSNQMENTTGVMMIDPKARVSDYLKAFDLLRKEKTAPKIFIQLRQGQRIGNLIDISALPDNTLIAIRSNTTQGVKIEIVPVEEIALIGHQ